MRLVADLVRGKSVNDALGLLKFTPRAGATPIAKAIQSAVANLVNSDKGRDVNPDSLVIKLIFVDEGPTYKRFMPRAMGRATPIRKRTSHIAVVISTPEAPEEAETEMPDVESETAAAPVKEKSKVKSTAKPKAKAKAKADEHAGAKRSVKKKKTE